MYLSYYSSKVGMLGNIYAMQFRLLQRVDATIQLTLGGGGATQIAARGTGASTAGVKPSWKVLRHAPHELYKNTMKKIAVLFHLTALGSYTPDNRPTNYSHAILACHMESQSQQCVTTIVRTSLSCLCTQACWYMGLYGCCLFTH